MKMKMVPYSDGAQHPALWIEHQSAIYSVFIRFLMRFIADGLRLNLVCPAEKTDQAI